MIEIAVKAVKEAGDMLSENFYQKREVSLKSEKDFVTKLDIYSEQQILDLLKQSFPDHNYLSEELGCEDNKSEYTWIIDPLCSSNNYVFSMPLYGLSVGLVYKGKALLGAAYIPQLDYLFFAEKNKGAFLNNNRIYVSKRKNISESLMLYDNQFYKDVNMFGNLKKIIDTVFTMRITGSAVFDLCMVAMGAADARIFHKTKLCDFIAGSLMVEEAGGKSTNFRGEQYSMKDSSVIVSNGLIHEQILEILNEK